MTKFLAFSAAMLGLLGPAHAATVTLNWPTPVPAAGAATDITGMEVWDQQNNPSFPNANTRIAQLGATAQTFTTQPLLGGQHTFTVVAVYGEGSAAPSNSVTFSVSVVLTPVSGLTGVLNP
jgi:hypothetical protein